MSHSNEDYAHYAERQKWIDELRDDINGLARWEESEIARLAEEALDAVDSAGA